MTDPRAVRVDRRTWYTAAWLVLLAAVVGVQGISLSNRLRGITTTTGVSDADRAYLDRELAPFGLSVYSLDWYWIAIGVVTLAAYAVIGWLLVRRGNPVGFSAYLATVMLALTAASYPPDIPEAYPNGIVIQRMVLCLTAIAISGFLSLPVIFPDGRFIPRWGIAILIYNVSGIAFLAGGGVTAIVPDIVATPVALAATLGIAAYRYRRVSTPDQRRQTRVVMLGFLVGLPCFFISDAMMRNIHGSGLGVVNLVGFLILNPIGFNLPFLAVGAAMLFHHLFDVDVVLSRTLVWFVMTGLVVGAYIGIVIGLGSLFRIEENLPLSLLATGIVAVAFQPIRERVQRGINRLLFGKRDDPYAVISQVGHQVAASVGVDDLLPQIARTMREALRTPYVGVFLDRLNGPELVASAGQVTVSPLQLPLAYQGTAIGRLDVAPRSPGEAFSGTDRRLLDDLAQQIGIAAHMVTLAADLQRSREAIVLSREEERRRLRRDLHDGLGAQLAALAMQTGVIRSQVRTDQVGADAALLEFRQELRGAIDEVRRLVSGLRPPALDELGLAGAIRARLDRIRLSAEVDAASAPMVYVTIDDALPILSAAVEVAALRIVDEAVTNAVRHADARHLWVSVSYVEEHLVATVEDDGIGFAAEAIVPGVGLQSMRERARELGGTLDLGQREGAGTRIVVHLPVGVGMR